MLRWVLVLLSACHPTYQYPYSYQYRSPPIEQIRKLAVERTVIPSCKEGKSTSRTGMAVVRSAVFAEQPCGLVVNDILEPAEVDRFVAGVCKGERDADCDRAATDMFVARMSERYEHTDWQSVLNKCKAYPIECQQWEQLERWVLKSHNDWVAAWANAEIQRVQQQAAAYSYAQYQQQLAQEADRRKAIAEGFQAMARSLARKPTIHCTSNTYGYSTTTDCQ